MSVQTYTVDGMTCGHCAAAVDRELRTVTGVADVAVDVAASTVAVTVTAETAPEDAAIAAAVEEAGYTLVGRA